MQTGPKYTTHHTNKITFREFRVSAFLATVFCVQTQTISFTRMASNRSLGLASIAILLLLALAVSAAAADDSDGLGHLSDGGGEFDPSTEAPEPEEDVQAAAAAAADLGDYGYGEEDVFDSRRAALSDYSYDDEKAAEPLDSGGDSVLADDGEEGFADREEEEEVESHHRRRKHYHHRKSDNETANPKGKFRRFTYLLTYCRLLY